MSVPSVISHHRIYVCGHFTVCMGKYGQVWTIIRKILWNFLRVESRLADLYKKYALIEIMSVSQLNDFTS
jgi:hypothetical protein